MLFVSCLFSASSYAVFIDYAGTGKMNGREISMTMQVDDQIAPAWIILGMKIGDYTIDLDGVGTTSGNGNSIAMLWSDSPERETGFYNFFTMFNTLRDGPYLRHNRVKFMDGTGGGYDFSTWRSGSPLGWPYCTPRYPDLCESDLYDLQSWQFDDFELPPEIAITELDLGDWGRGDSYFGTLDLHLHAVPLPATLWLFGIGLSVLLGALASVDRAKNALPT